MAKSGGKRTFDENGLNDRQKKFCDLYLETGNATQSAIAAGYSAKSAGAVASETLNNPKVEKYLVKRREEISNERIAGPQEVLEYLTAILRDQSESEIVVVVGEGGGISRHEHVRKLPDEKEKLKAAEMLGKRYRLFTENVNLEGNVKIIFSGEDDLED